MKEGLVFDKHSCELIGFTDLGDINKDLTRLEEECESSIPCSTVASHMLLLMVRSLFRSVNFPYELPTLYFQSYGTQWNMHV